MNSSFLVRTKTREMAFLPFLVFCFVIGVHSQSGLRVYTTDLKAARVDPFTGYVTTIAPLNIHVTKGCVWDLGTSKVVTLSLPRNWH